MVVQLRHIGAYYCKQTQICIQNMDPVCLSCVSGGVADSALTITHQSTRHLVTFAFFLCMYFIHVCICAAAPHR